jgi:tRNA (guanine37-N1)-methyltransferase
MSSEKPFLKVRTSVGDQVRKALLQASLLDTDYRIESDDGMLFFPLQRELEIKNARGIIGDESFVTGVRSFVAVSRAPRTLRQALIDKLTTEEVGLLPRAYDLVGDIAVLEIPDGISQYKLQIGQAFLAAHKSVSTVLAKKGAVSGVTRTREYEFLAGENKTTTVQLEYGCRIAVDLAAAYFSPRLLEEHQRVARQVSDGELVVDMFTGVGCFALHIARLSRSRVVAVDINPEAIRLLEESMRMNRLKGTIVPVVADSHDYITGNFNRNANRVIMNHPSSSYQFVSQACQAIKKGGVIHYYEFVGEQNPEQRLIERVASLVKGGGREVLEIEQVRRVRESAPHEYQMVADLIIR